jgi:hypothetical protein
MKAKITYNLSEIGRRAALAAGLPGSEKQCIEIEVGTADLDLFAVRSDGALEPADLGTGAIYRGSCYGSGWADVEYDNVLAADQIIPLLRGRADARAAVLAGRDAQRAEERETAMREMLSILAAGSTKNLAVGDDEIRFGSHTFSAAATPAVAAACAARAQRVAAADSAYQLNERRRARHTAIDQVAPAPVVIPTTPAATGFSFSCPYSSIGEGWAKHLTSVDINAQGGYAYDGAWLKCGGKFTLAGGELVVVGGKAWVGSKKNGAWKHDLRIFCVTPADLLRIPDESKEGAGAILALTGPERVELVLTARIAQAERLQKSLIDLLVSMPEDTDFIHARIAEWKQVQALCEQANRPVELPIGSLDEAAAAIIAAGFRALAKTHHPDAGGSHAAMALLSEARKQLTDLMKLAGVSA